MDLQIDKAIESLALVNNDLFVLQVTPGEEIMLTYLANPFTMEDDTLEKYAIIAILDGQALAINGDPYLLINAVNSTGDTIDYGTFTIQAPDLPGRYTFFSLIIVLDSQVAQFLAQFESTCHLAFQVSTHLNERNSTNWHSDFHLGITLERQK